MIRVQAQILGSLIEQRSVPIYPEEAVKAGNQGDVILKVDVDESGKVIVAAPVVGDPVLVAASIEALRNFRFRPYLLGGMPVRVESQLGFHFSLEHRGADTKRKVEMLSDIPFRPEFKTGVMNAAGVVVLFPVKVSGQEPQLPPSLEGKPGSVYLTITVGADGKVQDVRVIAGDTDFIDPVVNAVRQFVYEPQLLDGKPSASTIKASYHFGPRS
jgi:TonB family protein